MNIRNIYDYLKAASRFGQKVAFLPLYPKQEQSLVKNGFVVLRTTGLMHCRYRNQFYCNISWQNASKGTLAYELLETANKVNAQHYK